MRRETFDRLFPALKGELSASGPMIAADHLAFLLNEPPVRALRLDQVCRSGELLAEGLQKAQRLYQSDFIIVFSDVSVEAEALGVKLEYLPGRNPQPVRHLPWEEVRVVDMASRGRLPELFGAARTCRERFGGDSPIFFSMKDPFSLAAMAVGTEPFLEKLVLEPEVALGLLEICRENQLGLIKVILSEGFIPFIGAPIASGGLIGAKNFERFALPYLRPLFDLAEETGSFRCLHICGEIGMLAKELASLNLDLLSFEDWHAEMWPLMPNTISMGFVPTDLFQHGDTKLMREAVSHCKSVMPAPFVLSTGCDLPAKAKPELVQTMMRL